MHAIWDARSRRPDLNRAQIDRDLNRDAFAYLILHSALGFWKRKRDAGRLGETYGDRRRRGNGQRTRTLGSNSMSI